MIILPGKQAACGVRPRTVPDDLNDDPRVNRQIRLFNNRDDSRRAEVGCIAGTADDIGYFCTLLDLLPPDILEQSG